MKWKEVKEQIEAGGVTDEMDMWFIDISFSDGISVCPEVKEEDEADHPNNIGFSVTN